ncbi:hypothetical protein SAMN02910418_01304 [Bowdeniella nasicola]|uniref:Uncharacterized protein n=1 Tax=Bowdeniella nasicola TaxID=208480 RepID=A0A1H4A2E4_9ACTO|nr:hypothetical protein [Bowdeniella nasicola]SEA30146.1 hypothetical protein SAMN02910418_01304 [Bowdeniella nasicola]
MFATDLMWGPATPLGLTSAKLATIVGVLTLVCLLIAIIGPELARDTEPTSKRRWLQRLAPAAMVLGQLLFCAQVFLFVNRIGWFYSSFADLFG